MYRSRAEIAAPASPHRGLCLVASSHPRALRRTHSNAETSISLSISRGPIAILALLGNNESLVTQARSIHAAMVGNPSFPAPTPTMAVLQTDITALDDAETQASTRAKGTIAVRDARKMTLMSDLRYLCNHVQTVADAQANEADAIAVIKCAGMEIRKRPVRSKPALEARPSGSPGAVILLAKAIERQATYFWEYSLDQQTWTSGPETMKARAEITGLLSANTCAFRFRALTPWGPVPYSQVMTRLVD